MSSTDQEKQEKLEKLKQKMSIASKILGWIIISVVAITHPESLPILCGAGLVSCSPFSSN